MLVAAGSFSLSRTKAHDPLIAVCGTPALVRQYAGRAVTMLTVANFAQTVPLTRDVCDVYGITINGAGWYIKLCIDEAAPEVVFISFHPPAWPLKTVAGVVQPPKPGS